MKILVVKLAAIGDVLRTTAILPGLKEKYPDSEIEWATSPAAIPFIASNKMISKAYSIGKDNIRGIYDIVINLDEDIEACRLASSLKGEKLGFFLGKDGKITHSKSAKEWFDMSRLGKKPENDLLKAKNRKTHPQIMYGICGLDYKKQEPVLVLGKEDKIFAEKFRQKNNILGNSIIVGLNTGAGGRWEKKKLSEEKTAELAGMLSKKLKAKIILFGGPEEEERNRRIISMSNINMIDAGCNNSLMRFAALISLCDAIVVSDSLALHIAVALKKKVIVFFGPTSSAEIELYGRGTKVLPKTKCRSFYKPKCSEKNCCIDTIMPEDIFKAVGEILR